jgi:hypothetical protein
LKSFIQVALSVNTLSTTHFNWLLPNIYVVQIGSEHWH